MARNKYPEETVNLILDKSLMLFIEKGYDNTSIQDIINSLGGLTKGAIYHHFKSKEEIFETVCEKIGKNNAAYFENIRDDKNLNGKEKLTAMIESACSNPTNDAMFAIMSKILSEPKFFKMQILEIYDIIAPYFVRPIIEEGIKDGSIKTDYPKELSEVIITLLNIWVNPIISRSSEEAMRNKMEFLELLLKGIGLDILNDEIIEKYVQLFRYFNN